MREEMKWFRSLEARKKDLEFGFELGCILMFLERYTGVHFSAWLLDLFFETASKSINNVYIIGMLKNQTEKSELCLHALPST